MTDTLKPAELDLEALKKVALAVTPGDIDSAPEKGEYGHKEHNKWYSCPTCDGQGEVFGATYCNFDDKPLGVQFFGIGAEFGRWEDYFRAFRPSAVLSLLTRIEALEAERDEAATVWPEWAAAIRAKLLEYGADLDDDDGTCDLAAAFSDWCDGYAYECERQTKAAEAQRDRMREALELAGGFLSVIPLPEDRERLRCAIEAALSQGTAGSSGAGE